MWAAAWCSPAAGVIGGLSLIRQPIFMPLFWVALIGNFVLIPSWRERGDERHNGNGSADPWRPTSLITGFTLERQCVAKCDRHARQIGGDRTASPGAPASTF